MKNIIAENFLRFAPKNLSEVDLQKLNDLTNKSFINEVTGLSIVPAFADSTSTNAKLLRTADNDIIAFPAADARPDSKDDGFPTAGDLAANSDQSVACYLGNYAWLILGNIGQLVGDGVGRPFTLTNISPRAMIIVTKPGVADGGSRPGAGRALRYLRTYNNTTNYIQILVDAIEQTGDNQDSWPNWGKPRILTAYRLASNIGVVPALNDYVQFRDQLYTPLNKVGKLKAFPAPFNADDPDGGAKAEFTYYQNLRV